MLTELKREDEVKELLSCLEQDIAGCLYLYIDLMRYGLQNEHIRVWAEKKAEGFGMIAMKYHDSFQLYARLDNYRKIELLSKLFPLLRGWEPSRISGPEPLIRKIAPLFRGMYTATYGAIFRQRKESVFLTGCGKQCRIAELSDVPLIADLLMTAPEFSGSYSREELIQQMCERIRTDMGRSMIIRDKEKVNGHIATFAEAGGVAVVSGAVIRREFRNTDYFEELSEALFAKLCNEEKRDAYFFADDKRLIRLFEKTNERCGSYGKLIKPNAGGHERWTQKKKWNY